jgi:hypothetical protein
MSSLGQHDLNPVFYAVLLKGRILVANNSGSRRMIAGSVANNVGLNARQLHLIPVEKCADCRFVGFRLQVVTVK